MCDPKHAERRNEQQGVDEVRQRTGDSMADPAVAAPLRQAPSGKTCEGKNDRSDVKEFESVVLQAGCRSTFWGGQYDIICMSGV